MHDPMPLQPPPMPVLAMAGNARRSRLLARLLALLSVLLALSLVVVPWQQSVRGSGRVIAFNPLDRRANIEAPVEGRVRRLNVVENQSVRQGDVIAEIQDNDPNLLLNLRLQHDAAVARKAAAAQRIIDLDLQIESQELAKPQAVDAAQQRVNAEQFVVETNEINARRMEQLLSTGDISRRDWELTKLALDSARANLAAAKAVLERTARDYDATISSTKASRGLAEADLAAATRDIAAVDIQISKSEQQVVLAPRDGIVLNVAATEGAYLKPGSPICVLIPQTEERFVEAWIDGMDMPLIAPRGSEIGSGVGSRVRLQFEGWPAVQFVGWPSVAVGTFGGEVVSIDAVDDGAGRFRIVIRPDPDDAPWPDTQYLRQGVRTKAWVLLRTVPLWQEVWRQLNGFPPVVAPKEPVTKKAPDA
ncbi:MAG: HlyD family efflux transporter periplasmic adaptor subunit [Planctomycetes bacterium]|nr:HlyD family efflux transporter periplasmic adaptor subunit [Planctomycetota bacterium]